MGQLTENETPARAQAVPAAGGAVTPVGTWREKFLVNGEEYTSVLHFTPGGKAFILSGPAPGGGAGTWEPAADGGFSYRIAEFYLDERGAYVGRVDIDHHAVLSGDSFTSSGVSRVYDGNDELTVSAQIEATATRV